MHTAAALFVLALASTALGADYVVLEAESDDPQFQAAAARLAKHHGATRLKFRPDEPQQSLRELRRLAPRYVALVMPAEQVEFAFQRRFLELATQLDDDPFVDFAYGYVTGASGAEALAFVESCIRAEKPKRASLGKLSGSTRDSKELKAKLKLRTVELPMVHARVQGGETGHDRTFLASALPKVAQRTAILFSGHGRPDRVIGVVDADDLADVRFDGAVVLSVACWNGTTGRWYGADERRTLAANDLPAKRSVALALLRTGLCGYTAYLCPRPAGPELQRDLVSLVVNGASLGDTRRRDYDKTVLGYLGFGDRRMTLEPLAVGKQIPRGRDAVRDIMLEDATGGVVFGDPALRPFTPLPGEDPIDVRTETVEGGIVLTATCPRRSLWLHCVDPTARFDGGPAMKVYARVPLGSLRVSKVVADSVRVGPRHVESRVIWALEEDHGERFLQVKVVFPRQDGRQVGPSDGLAIGLRVVAAPSGRKGKRFGDTRPPRRR